MLIKEKKGFEFEYLKPINGKENNKRGQFKAKGDYKKKKKTKFITN